MITESVLKITGEPDLIEIFGDSGSAKTSFCIELVKEAIKSGKKVKYIDTEKNLKGKLEGADYEYNPDFSTIFKIVQNLKPGYDLVILDSLGLPILGEFATVSLKEKGNFLLQAQAMSYMLKKYACNNKCMIFVTNQPESEFNKDRDHVLRPFGDKSIYFYKEVWKTEKVFSTPDVTTCVVNAFRSRNYGQGYRLFNIKIAKDATTITETPR
jgi:RecA/RadA recombinase